MKRVLILCTGNSCRSQMAEAIWETLGGEEWSATSAGSRPAGYVHPLAIDVMRELGADLSEYRSKSVESMLDDSFDVVVSVCDNARDSCPTFTNALQTLHWPFDDPADATGSDEEKLQTFRRIRDEIQAKIHAYLQDS